MNYRSVADLSRVINSHLHEISRDIDIIVGIPRSGMLPASIIALKLNLPVTDLYSFIRNDELKTGNTRKYKNSNIIRPHDSRKILLVDDSISSGKSMKEAIDQLSHFTSNGGAVVSLAIYAERANRSRVDKHFEIISQPRMFEWNIMHHPRLDEACVDIDGVLCVDPDEEENDDGQKYLNFIRNARPLVIPSTKIKHIVTSRLEKYREPTQEWLDRNGVQYQNLHMLDLPTAEERRRLKMHHKFKAAIYSSDREASLFIESETEQAKEIMLATNKVVFCTADSTLYAPGTTLPPAILKAKITSFDLLKRAERKLRRHLGGIFSLKRSR